MLLHPLHLQKSVSEFLVYREEIILIKFGDICCDKLFFKGICKSPSCLAHVVKSLTFQKGRVWGGEGSRVRVLMRTVYYIVTKVNSKKKA